MPVSVASHRDLHVRGFVERFPSTPAFQELPTLVMLGNVAISPTEMSRVVALCHDSQRPLLFTVEGVPVGGFSPTPLALPSDAVPVFEGTDLALDQHIAVDGVVVEWIWQSLDLIPTGTAWDSVLVESHVSPRAKVHATVVIDDTSGPILIADHAEIGAYSVLKGPVVVGEYTVVKEHSLIGGSVIGPKCKVAGEISASIIHGYSNKAHYGFLGHSFVGAWCNLGAGTTTSNLKNTYGNVSVRFPDGMVDTKRQFLGSCIGDFSKTGIGTLLNTGCMVGTCCNVVSPSTGTSYIPSFSWVSGSVVSAYNVSKALQHTQLMMDRRNVVIGEEVITLLNEIAKTSNG